MIYELGSKGDGVSEIQLALRIAGYAVTVDGDYGLKTQEAVKQFQRSRGIGADGIVGPVTMKLLQDVLATGQTQAAGGLSITKGYIYQQIWQTYKITAIKLRFMLPSCFNLAGCNPVQSESELQSRQVRRRKFGAICPYV